jgi:hypothetical protein
MISLATALRNPQLFGGSFAGSSWWPWHVVAKLMSGEVLDAAEVDLFKKSTGRTKLPARPPRRLYLLVGRRGAKSRFASAAAVHAAISTDWHGVMAPGETATAVLLAVDRAQAQICRNYAMGLIRSSSMLQDEVARETSDTIALRNGAEIVIGTNDHRSIRGRSVIALIGDECCFWKSDGESASSDEEVLAAAEPGMAMTPGGGVTVLISTVYRKKGLMHRKWKELFGNDEAEDICWLADTPTMNPLLPAGVIADAMAKDAARAKAEYLSQWREDLTDFIPADVVEACTDWGVREREREVDALLRFR